MDTWANLLDDAFIDNRNISHASKQIVEELKFTADLDKRDHLLQIVLILTLADLKGVLLAHHRATKPKSSKQK